MNTVFIKNDEVDLYCNGLDIDECISIYVDELNERTEKEIPPFFVEVYKKVGEIKFKDDPDEGYCYTVEKTDDN